MVYTALGPLDPSEFKQSHKRDNSRMCMEKPLRVYAVKELPRSRRCRYEKEALCHQIVAACPGVVTLHHVIEEPEATYLVMVRTCQKVVAPYSLETQDYHPEGDLCSSLSNNFAVYENSQHAKSISLQLLTAVQQCHDLNVFHRDLKPDNILLVDGGTRVVISDFGLSTRQEQTVDFSCGSKVYMSPGAPFSAVTVLISPS